jgi:hypothetical protein
MVSGIRGPLLATVKCYGVLHQILRQRCRDSQVSEFGRLSVAFLRLEPVERLKLAVETLQAALYVLGFP